MRVSLPVEGMTCASCVARIEKVLTKIDGIENVSVNLATERAAFDIDRAKVTPDVIAKAVEDYGYKIDVEKLIQPDAKAKKGGQNTFEKHEQELLKDFRIALIFSIPVALLSMLYMWEGFRNVFPFSNDTLNKLLLILSAPVIFIPGKRFFTSFWKNMLHFSADMNSLVAIGTGSAFLFSLIITLFPQLMHMHDGVVHTYFDTSVVIITLILMGKWLESRSKRKTTNEIQKLLALTPKEALVKRNGVEVVIPLEQLVIGDRVITKPGERIPADGIIVLGSSTVDESMITGESFPVKKSIGARIIGATINKNGYFEFEVTAIGDNSVLGHIITMVEDAQGSKAPIQNLADTIASVFVPVVLLIAFITLVGWFIVSPDPISIPLMNFIAVLIIACPCALGLATPTAIMVATGNGAKKGILIKNGEALEIAHKINVLLIDKTGTITEGNPSIVDSSFQDELLPEIIALTASVEAKSEHPIASAIVSYAQTNNIEVLQCNEFTYAEGKGVSGIVNEKTIHAGNWNYIVANTSSKISKPDITGKDGIIIYVGINKQYSGYFVLADKVKENSAKTIAILKKMGIHTVMLTGDAKHTAEAVGKEVCTDEVVAEILPDEKAHYVQKFQRDGKIVGMVGDGINDAPALAASDIAFAIGSGTDVAIETASITILRNDLSGVVDAINLSKKTIRVIKQNLFWAFVYNSIGIPLAAFGLLNPMFAAFAMSMSSVSVISNSLRLRK